MNQFFLDSFWPGLTACVLLYISDCTMTLTCARMYRKKVSEFVVFEGSYELTPYFQRDINSLRKISPRFVGALLFSVLLLGIVWVLSARDFPQLYAFALGSMILLQLTIHIRQRRISSHSVVSAKAPPFAAVSNIDGRSPSEHHLPSFLCLRGSYLLLFILVPTWFLIGGVAACLSTAVKHRRLARKAALPSTPAPQSQEA